MRKLFTTKVVRTALLSAILASSSITSVFADMDEEVVLNEIGNRLQLQFDVREYISNDMIALTWSDGAPSDQVKKFKAYKNQKQTFKINVAPGYDLTEEISMGVLLQIPTENREKISSVIVGEEVAPDFISADGSLTYFVLKDGLEMKYGSDPKDVSVDITFKSITNQPIGAEIIVVKEQEHDQVQEPTETPDGYVVNYNKFESIELNINSKEDLNNGTVYITLPEGASVADGFYWIIERPYPLTSDMISEDGKTITIPNITVSYDYTFKVDLQLRGGQAEVQNRTIGIKIDADGPGTNKSISEEAFIEFSENSSTTPVEPDRPRV